MLQLPPFEARDLEGHAVSNETLMNGNPAFVVVLRGLA